MAEILLASGHWREALLLHSSVGGVCKEDLPLAWIFFLILGKIDTFSEPFFLNMCEFTGLKLNLKQQFSNHL